MLKYYRLRDYNFKLAVLLLLISVIGVLLVGSADASLQNRQLAGVIIGFVLMVIVSLMDYRWILKFYGFIYIILVALLLWVLLYGAIRKGAARWIAIGGESGFQFQPTELVKIMLILFFAMYFSIHEDDLSTRKVILKSLFFVAVPLLMIIQQPDLKNTITIAIVFCCLYFSAGLSYRRIGKILLIVVPIILVLFFLIVKTDLPILDEYQKSRIMTFLQPEDDAYSETAMQQENSVMAIGSGQLTGKGLNNNEVSSASKGNFVAEIQNDFIFAVAGEELGFVGCVLIILILFLIVTECILAGQRANDRSGMLICNGMASLVAIQSFINICVACGLIPNTGTPLPFVSYGLTSLVSLYIGMGFVMNISLQRKRSYGGEFLYAQQTRQKDH